MPDFYQKIATLRDAQQRLSSYYGENFEFLPYGRILATTADFPLRLILPAELPCDENGNLFAPGDDSELLSTDHPLYAQLGAPASCQISLMTGRFRLNCGQPELEILPPDQATHVVAKVIWLSGHAPTVADVTHKFDALTAEWYYRIDGDQDLGGADCWVFTSKAEMFKNDLSMLAYDTQEAIAAGQVFQKLYPRTMLIYAEYMKDLLQPLLIQHGDEYVAEVGEDAIELFAIREGHQEQINRYEYTLSGAQHLNATVRRLSAAQ